MSLRHYYRTLGLQENASDQEVRRKYRSLAMRYHPDKNPSPEAKETFIRITEAYEIILGKQEAPVQVKATGSAAQGPSKKKSNEDRVKEAQRRYKEQQYKEAVANEQYYQSLINGKKWKMIRVNALLGGILSLLLVLDVFLPGHYEEDRVKAYARDIYSAGGGKHVSLIATEKGQEFWIENINFSLYAYYPEIYIERTRIFHDPVNVISRQKLQYAYFPVHYTFRAAVVPTVLIFLIPLFTLWYKRRTIMFTVLWHLSLYLTGGALIFFLLANDHWAHLLTLGFL